MWRVHSLYKKRDTIFARIIFQIGIWSGFSANSLQSPSPVYSRYTLPRWNAYKTEKKNFTNFFMIINRFQVYNYSVKYVNRVKSASALNSSLEKEIISAKFDNFWSVFKTRVGQRGEGEGGWNLNRFSNLGYYRIRVGLGPSSLSKRGANWFASSVKLLRL